MAEDGKTYPDASWLHEFRNFQQQWNAQRATEESRKQAQAIRDHWQGRTPPAQTPILVQAYLAQQERQRRAIEPEGAEVSGHPGRYYGSHAEEWTPAQGKAYRQEELARKAREEARERRGINPEGSHGRSY